MAHDQLEAEGQTTRRAGGGRFFAAGVAGACVLGAGLGLWARPSALERGDAPEPARPEAEAKLSDRRLQIVLDDGPAPIGQPLEVMPADTPGLVFSEPQPGPGEPLLPISPPAGLMKVDAPAPAAVAALPAVIPAVRAEPKPEPRPEPKAERPKTKAAPAKALTARAEKPKAETPKRPAKVAKTEARPKPKPKPKKEPTSQRAEAKASKTKLKSTDTAKARSAKVAKAEPAKTARSESKAKPPAKLSKLVKAVKTAPKKLKDEAAATAERKKKDRELAAARAAKRAKAEKAKAKAKPPVEKASASKKKPVPRGEGPMRVARKDDCASSDPGEALVCADPRLHQRDRQLQRAMRDAEAAGVPASALRRQQERLRQARAAAARDGSWAVEDVYEARIAELNDLARDARDF